MGTQYRLCRVEIVFTAQHGKLLDRQDNLAFVAKPLYDALVNLGFAGDDSQIETKVTQEQKAGTNAIVSYICEKG